MTEGHLGAQSVKHSALHFSSGHGLWVERQSPASGSAQPSRDGKGIGDGVHPQRPRIYSIRTKFQNLPRKPNPQGLESFWVGGYIPVLSR